jgi:hypothetical protein
MQGGAQFLCDGSSGVCTETESAPLFGNAQP